MKIKKLLLLFVISHIATNASAAACEYFAGHAASTRNIVLPTSVSIPRDAPDGTVIYESAPTTYSGNNSFKCSDPDNFGFKNHLGNDVPGVTQPIGNTGIGWQWIRNGSPLNGIVSGGLILPGGYGFNGETYALRFLKISKIQNNAKIPAGRIGAIQVGTISPLTLQINSMAIVVPSCETPDVIVNMGNHELSELSYNTTYTGSKRFSIKLNNCPSGIKKVNYKFLTTAGAPAKNPALGIISLNASSTAKGIALQILDSDEKPINLNTAHTFNDYVNSGGNFEIPLLARYIKQASGNGDKTIKAGTANTEITFVMSYL